MRRTWFVMSGALVLAAGCTLPPDSGKVMGCFGLVNETVPGQDVFSNQIVTNMFFGGCSPDDSGMQIMERATPAASQDQGALALRCDQDCNTRLNAYQAVHNDATLPLTCQTLFASQCDNLSADAPLSNGGMSFQGGGPADTRYTLTGTVAITINGVASPTVQGRGIIDATIASPCAAGTTCPFTLSRFDFLPTQLPFTMSGQQVDFAQFQNQGLVAGSRNAGNTVINANAIEGELSYIAGGVPGSFHVRNSDPINKNATNLTLDQFLSSLTFTMTGPTSTSSTGVKVTITMNGTPAGHRPVAAIAPSQTTYECQCKECTTAEFTAAATDQDNDLQSLSWKLNNVVQIADGTSAPQTLDLQLGIGQYNLSLVATDSRGAAAGTSLQFSVVDTTPPVVTPPPNITLRACDFPDIGRATATDICSDSPVITSNSPGVFPVGTTTVVWTAQDRSLNQGTATQTVTVTSVANFQTCCPAGYNIMIVPNGNVPFNGTAGNDCIIGTDNNDTINGLGGNDIIFGRGGQDRITGGDGDDYISLGEGVNQTNQTADGGNGNDRILGGGGTDTITSGPGADIIIGGDGDDVIDTGDGDDVIYGNGGQDRIVGGLGNDLIDGGNGDDQINGGTTPATGNAGDDTIMGSFNNDVITDTVGNNTIVGFEGDDRLTGGPGNDTILGGAGHDTCVGGGGSSDTINCVFVRP